MEADAGTNGTYDPELTVTGCAHGKLLCAPQWLLSFHEQSIEMQPQACYCCLSHILQASKDSATFLHPKELVFSLFLRHPGNKEIVIAVPLPLWHFLLQQVSLLCSLFSGSSRGCLKISPGKIWPLRGCVMQLCSTSPIKTFMIHVSTADSSVGIIRPIREDPPGVWRIV